MFNKFDMLRRSFLLGAVGTALAVSEKAAAGAAIAAPSPMKVGEAAESPSLAKPDIDRMMTELSNWGRWGKEDQMGTVNLITAAKRKHAVSLVREVTVVSLSHAQDTEKSLDNTRPLIHVMNGTGEGAAGSGGSWDTCTMTFHGTYYTHMDALCHQFYDGHMYNGYPQNVVTSAGASKLDIGAFKGGIVTRGILMDIPRLKGSSYLEPETPIYPEDLDAWEKQAHIKVASGDMLFIRTGRWARRAEKGSWALGGSAAGLYATCARWLKQRDVAVLASDAVSDVQPSKVDGVPLPIHKLVLVALGTPIFDNCDLEQLSETANRMNRWEFMVTAAPMVIPGGTGSPLNPLAIF
jgi:kynurenine formamidase